MGHWELAPPVLSVQIVCLPPDTGTESAQSVRVCKRRDTIDLLERPRQYVRTCFVLAVQIRPPSEYRRST